MPATVTNVFSQPNLLVNKFGKRVMNEDHMQNSTYLSNVAANQKDKVCFSVIDTSIAKYYMRNGLDVVNLVRTNTQADDLMEGIEEVLERGSNALFMADTIEELAEKAGIDPESLEETIDEYNDYCDSTDEEFFKDKRYMKPLRKAPCYNILIYMQDPYVRYFYSVGRAHV